jgi:DHA1 family tetracycline resistance protein-like MFS transporter
MVFPSMPVVVTALFDGDVSRSASFVSIITAVAAFLQFFSSSLYGTLSDDRGRKPIVLFSLFCFALENLAIYLYPSLSTIIFGSVLRGATGVVFTMASACIFDISTADSKEVGSTGIVADMGLLGASIGVAFIVGPLASAGLAEVGIQYGVLRPELLPYGGACMVEIINLASAMLWLPETRSFIAAVTPSVGAREGTCELLMRANPVPAMRLLNRSPFMRLMSLGLFVSIAASGVLRLWFLWTKEVFGWGVKENGMFLGLVGVCSCVVQGFVLRRVLPVLGERATVLLAVACQVCAMTLFGLTTSPWLMAPIMIATCFGFTLQPSSKGVISSRAHMTGCIDADERGALQGALGSVVTLGNSVGPLLLGQIFSACVRDGAWIYFPGAPFLASAALYLCAGAVFQKAFALPDTLRCIV